MDIKPYFKNNVKKVVLPLAIFSFLIILVFWKFFFYMNGYLDFGNMLAIFDPSSYLNSVFWLFNPFQNNGYILTVPSTQLGWLFLAHFLFYISAIFGTDASIKFLVFFSLLSLSVSFYLLITIFVSNCIARYVSTVFFVYNPFAMELFANGDFYYFVFESFFLLSLACLSFYYKTGATRHEIFALSLVLVFLSSSFNDVYYIGIFEFLIFGIISIYIFLRNNSQGFFRPILKFFMMMILLVPVSFPLLLGFFFSPISLSPSSPLSLPLSDYINNGIGVLNTIILKSYPPNVAWSSLAAYSTILSQLWDLLLVTLIIFVLFIGFIYKNKRAVLFSLLSVGSAIFASGSKGPLAPILTWAYSNLYGFQLLNYPYIITWLASTIFYSFLVALTIEILFTIKDNRRNNAHSKFLRKIYYTITKHNRFLFVLLITIVISIPIAKQGFYGENGIHSVDIPSSYSQLSKNLSELSQNGYYGVAFFNPSVYLFYNNSTNDRFTNPVVYDIPMRTPAIPGYISEPLPSFNFFNWAFYKFYSNSTHYFPEILASVGYKYFVDLYNSNSADLYPLYMTKLTMNVNASKLLSHQFGVDEISSTKTYSIYAFNTSFSLANEAKSYSIFAGNYNLLTTATKDGLNLLKIAPVFIPDTLNQNLSSILNDTSSILEFNSNGVMDLILSHSPNYKSIFEISGIPRAWKNSFSMLTNWYVNEVAQTAPFLETSANASIEIPIYKNDSGKTLWIKVLESDVPGNSLKASIGKRNIASFSTYNETLDSNTTGFTWLKVRLPNDIQTGNVNLSFNGSYNGIEAYSIEPSSWYQKQLQYFNSAVIRDKIVIVNFKNETMHQLSEVFKNGSSIYGLLPLKGRIVPTDTGFSISGLSKGRDYLRIPWNGLITNICKIKTSSAFDSMGTIINITQNLHTINLNSSDFGIQIVGYGVTGVSTTLFVCISIFIRNKRKKLT